MRQILIIYSLLKNFTKMKRRHVIIAKNYSNNKFFIRDSRKNEEVIITGVIEKDSGHRYLLDIRGADNSKLDTDIKLYCKRVAIFVKRKLEEYDDTLKIGIIKLY